MLRGREAGGQAVIQGVFPVVGGCGGRGWLGRRRGGRHVGGRHARGIGISGGGAGVLLVYAAGRSNIGVYAGIVVCIRGGGSRIGSLIGLVRQDDAEPLRHGRTARQHDDINNQGNDQNGADGQTEFHVLAHGGTPFPAE